MRTLRRVAATLAAATIAVGGGLLVNPTPASAHGATMIPGSRTYLCWVDGLQSNGSIQPTNPACAAAVAQSGTTPLYNWFAVLDSNAAGRTSGYIPNGTICSAGNNSPYNFAPYNAARSDWPATRLTSGGSIQVRHSNWAHHPGVFHMYITNNSYNPNSPLGWGNLESQPFFSVTNPPQVGAVGTNDGYYNFGNVQMPSGKSGRHMIVTHWIRSDSNENFYSCSDVVFDGGNGQVIGIGGNQPPPPPPPTTTAPPPPPPTTTAPPPTTTAPPPPAGACSATYQQENAWGSGYQGGVTVTNGGSSASGSWTVNLTLPSGAQITQVWGGVVTGTSGNTVTVRNESWNGSIPANGSVNFGFLGSGGGGSHSATCSLS